ncbi:hypothetical protein BS78_08G096200 [Paspalum vaginatum]|nr:hypothetical protein BS78_08G096200 [Paspalum vaginatum]
MPPPLLRRRPRLPSSLPPHLLCQPAHDAPHLLAIGASTAATTPLRSPFPRMSARLRRRRLPPLPPCQAPPPATAPSGRGRGGPRRRMPALRRALAGPLYAELEAERSAAAGAASEAMSHHPATAQKPARTHHSAGPKKLAFKLYQRRIDLVPLAMAVAAVAGASPRKPATQQELHSHSLLDIQSLMLASPVMPLVADPFNRSLASASPSDGDRQLATRASARCPTARRPSPHGPAAPRGATQRSCAAHGLRLYDA